MEDLKTSETWRVFRIQSELVEGFETLHNLGPAVSIFGSSKLFPGNKYYDEAVTLARLLADDGFAIITGGGPGIMEGANRGAKKGKAPFRGPQYSAFPPSRCRTDTRTSASPSVTSL